MRSEYVRGVLDSLRCTVVSVSEVPGVDADPGNAVYPLTGVDAVLRVTLIQEGWDGEGISWHVAVGRGWETGDLVVVPLGDKDGYWSWIYDERGMPKDSFPVRVPLSFLDSPMHRVVFTTTLLRVGHLLVEPPFSLTREEVGGVLDSPEIVGVCKLVSEVLLRGDV